MRGHSLSHILLSLQAGRGEMGSARLGGAGPSSREVFTRITGPDPTPQSGPHSPLPGLAQSAASLASVISSTVIKRHNVNVNKV